VYLSETVTPFLRFDTARASAKAKSCKCFKEWTQKNEKGMPALSMWYWLP